VRAQVFRDCTHDCFVDSSKTAEYTLHAMESSGHHAVFTVAGIGITNTLLATLVVDAVILLVVFAVRRRLSLVPGKLQGLVEGVLDYLHTTTEQVAGSRTARIFPWVGIFFIYVALSNLIGLLPGFGTIGFFRDSGFVPLLQVSTADLNLTLALATVTVVATNVLAIRTLGLGAYLKRFFALNPLLLFVGLLELLQEVTKLITFSFRLFGNISAGEAVLGTMSSLMAFIVPVPFLAFEILVAVIQGLIFALLTLAFMTLLTEPHHKEE
jgi:F-type H+-transporting ATPase subunit a